MQNEGREYFFGVPPVFVKTLQRPLNLVYCVSENDSYHGVAPHNHSLTVMARSEGICGQRGNRYISRHNKLIFVQHNKLITERTRS